MCVGGWVWVLGVCGVCVEACHNVCYTVRELCVCACMRVGVGVGVGVCLPVVL